LIPVDFNEFKQMVIRLYQENPIIKHEVHDIIAKENKVIAKFSAKIIHYT